MPGTFRARGAGGTEFVFDELDPSSIRGEVLAGQIRRGDLVVIDDAGHVLGGAEQIEAFLASGEPVAVETEPGEEPSDVPTGKIEDVIDWVRGGPVDSEPTEGWADRAAQALDVEEAKGDKARTGLVEKLGVILEPAEPGDQNEA